MEYIYLYRKAKDIFLTGTHLQCGVFFYFIGGFFFLITQNL